MTQALAVHQFLSRRGHELAGAVIGSSGSRAVPEYVARALPAPIVPIESPGFALREGRGIDMASTAWHVLAGQRIWRNSLMELRSVVEQARPDLVVNFFEPLTGLLQLVRPLDVPVVSIAHQHMIGHRAHRTPVSARVNEVGLRAFASLVGHGSWKLALSLYPAPDLVRRRTLVGPPLLRSQLFELEPWPGDYYLVYMVHHGYHEEIRAWHRANPGTGLHCFYDRPGAPEEERAAPNLTFHRLDGAKFLRLMAGCRAVVTTAGFESVAEAAWLGKPVYLVPVEGHLEQQWNARDAVQAGLGIADNRFDLERLKTLPTPRDNARFRAWVASADDAMDRVIRRSLAEGPRGRGRLEVSGA